MIARNDAELRDQTRRRDEQGISGLFAQEEWRPVYGWDGLYSVSNFGRVRRDARAKGCLVGRILVSCINTRGYLTLNLQYLADNNRRARRTVHSLVAEAFIGPRPPKMDVNHIDGDKANNRVSNLEYLSRGDNHRHAFRLGLRQGCNFPPKPRVNLTPGDIRDIRASHYSQRWLASRYGISKTTIGFIKRRLTWADVE